MTPQKIMYIVRKVFAIFIGILSLAAFSGLFYPIKIFDLQIGALIQRVFVDFSITALILSLFIIILTFVFGRIYCSTLCPLGIFQELVGMFKKKTSGYQKHSFVKYFIAAIIFGSLMGGTVYLLRLLEPYTYFGSAVSLSLIGIIAVIAILIIVIFKDRFFCTNICPVGTLLGVISKYSISKIFIKEDTCSSCGICSKKCPSGSINFKEKIVHNESCVKCLKCLTVCPKASISYGHYKSIVEPDLKKRKIILNASIVAAFAAAGKFGNIIKKVLQEKFSDVILPPGAITEMRFINKCVNCNLCVKVCPTRIIKKADGNYSAVSIDYSNGFCEYTCNECSAVCPSGAIKRLSLSEKQNLRIGMIAPPLETFKEFDACVEACPTKALTLRDNMPVFIALKCIGCGACVTNSNGIIQIYGTNEQRFLQ